MAKRLRHPSYIREIPGSNPGGRTKYIISIPYTMVTSILSKCKSSSSLEWAFAHAVVLKISFVAFCLDIFRWKSNGLDASLIRKKEKVQFLPSGPLI